MLWHSGYQGTCGKGEGALTREVHVSESGERRSRQRGQRVNWFGAWTVCCIEKSGDTVMRLQEASGVLMCYWEMFELHAEGCGSH